MQPLAVPDQAPVDQVGRDRHLHVGAILGRVGRAAGRGRVRAGLPVDGRDVVGGAVQGDRVYDHDRADRTGGAWQPHGDRGEIAETVLMPGDPYRARWAAETFLDTPRLVNEVRRVLKPGGRFQAVDLVLVAELPEQLRNDQFAWSN